MAGGGREDRRKCAREGAEKKDGARERQQRGEIERGLWVCVCVCVWCAEREAEHTGSRIACEGHRCECIHLKRVGGMKG